MPFHRPPATQLVSRVAVSLGIVLFVAGSVLVFMVPREGANETANAKPTQTPTYSAEPKPDPALTHDLLPEKVKPSKTKSATPSARPKSTTSPPRPSASPTPPTKPKPTPTISVRPTPTLTPTYTPSATPAPPATVPAPANSALRAQVIYLINQQRANVGVGALSSNSNFSDQCQTWSAFMASRNVLQHSSMYYGGEIIASGATTAEQVVQLWLNSPPHRAIMLDGRYTLIGSGYVNGYWTVQFG